MEFNKILHNQELLDFTIERLTELQGYYTGYGCDLHTEIFNTDYYIIGSYQAKEWLGLNVFDCIEAILDYENDMFGEVYTDVSEPEKVVNMYVYIVGEFILGLSDHLQKECYDRRLTTEDFEKIIIELQ